MTDAIEHLTTLFHEAKVREINKIEAIQKDRTKNRLVFSLRGINEIFFLYTAFVEGDFQKSKEYLFRMAMVSSYYFKRTGANPFEALETFTYPLLSDNETVTNRYSKYIDSENLSGFAKYFAQSIQAILLKNPTSLEENISKLEKKFDNRWEQNYSGIITSLKGVLFKDVNEVEKGINEILDLHESQNHMPVTKRFINFPALAIAKLARRNNLNVRIENNLVPEDLIDFKPLENYKGYGFFEELNNSNEA